MAGKSSGRDSVKQNLSRMETSLKSTCNYLDWLEDKFAPRADHYYQHILLMKKVQAQLIEMFESFRKNV